MAISTAASSCVTPLVLTYNEEPNIARTLGALAWAKRVVVLDSGSTDGTESIASSFPNVEWRHRRFDTHQAQWEHGIRNTDIDTAYVLALDADMVVPAEFVTELERAFVPSNLAGGIVPFDFAINGRRLTGSIYPAQLRIFRPAAVTVKQLGHTQEFSADSPLFRFRTRVLHDDRKGLDRWVHSQLKYSRLESDRIISGPGRGARDVLRRLGIMPLFAGVLAYIRAGGPLAGRAAFRYALERTTFECLLAMRLGEYSDAATSAEKQSILGDQPVAGDRMACTETRQKT